MNSVVRNFVAAVIVSAVATSVYAQSDNSFRFIAFSDTHFSLYPNQVTQSVTEILAMTGANKPAAVFVNGDVTNLGADSEIADFKTRLRDPLVAAGIPVYVIVGNHDAHYNSTAIQFCAKLGIPEYQSVDIQKTHFVLTCGVPDNVQAEYGTTGGASWGIGQAGQIDTAQLNWIENDLKGYNNTHAKLSIMLDHFPLWSNDAGGYAISDYDWYGTRTNAATKLKQWVNQYGVDVYLYGHRHDSYGSKLRDAAGNIIWMELATVQDADTVFDPVILNYPNGGVTMSSLIDKAGAGTVYRYVNAQGQSKTGAAGYDVFDVNDYTISHYRKINNNYGFQFIGPQQEWSLTVPEPATLSLLAAGVMALLRRKTGYGG